MQPIIPIVKVCGMREAENIREVEALGIDLMGFIFWPKSSRYVSERPAYMPQTAKRVGVFVNEDIKQVKRIAEEYSLDVIQLHGSESPDYIRQLGSVCGDTIATVKAFNIATAADLDATKPYEGIVDSFLFFFLRPGSEASGTSVLPRVVPDPSPAASSCPSSPR